MTTEASDKAFEGRGLEEEGLTNFLGMVTKKENNKLGTRLDIQIID